MKQTKFLALAAAAMLLFGACKPKAEAPAEVASTDNIYQFTVLDGNLNPVNLADYKGKVLLVVNTATHCGFTPQYEELQKLYDEFNANGFEILDFPCNQFGEQAPGTNEEIHEFCTGTYNITFPQMAKIDVNGDDEDQSPLFAWLIGKAPFAGIDTTNPIGVRLDQMFRSMDSLYDQNPDIKWNFTKFLIDREGNVIRRFEPYEGYEPVKAALQEAL
jgi:glutathione peroxidase